MKEYKSIGMICVEDKYKFVYAVCKIEYFLYEDESFKYIFTPNYSVINLLDSSIFQGIPGLNLELKKENYVRDNINPTFISERVPSESREDYHELLERVHMEYMDPIKYLIRLDLQYSGDNLFVTEYEEKRNCIITQQENSVIYLKNIISNITKGNDVVLGDAIINNENRKVFFGVFLDLYKKMYSYNKTRQREGIERAKALGKYKGRKAQEVDLLKFMDLDDQVMRKKITRQELLDILGISKDKYYRIKKKLQN